METHNVLSFLHRWVFEDVWLYVWPNWAADVILIAIVYFVGKKKLQNVSQKMERNHNDMKTYIDAAVREAVHKKPPLPSIPTLPHRNNKKD